MLQGIALNDDHLHYTLYNYIILHDHLVFVFIMYTNRTKFKCFPIIHHGNALCHSAEDEEEDDLMIAWFQLVNEKNDLVRKECDYIYM